VAVPAVFSHLELCIVDMLSNDANILLFICYHHPSPNTDSDAIRLTNDLCNCSYCLYPVNGTVIICSELILRPSTGP
jgi:hypothetical protein